MLFEGWDASGKGGAVKRLVSPLDPRHVRVVQFAAPSYDEKRHHFLWRRRGYGEIDQYERLLTNARTILVKFFLHLSEAEQLKRFEARAKDPLKSWKLTDEDWRNHERRADYEAAIEEMLERTSTDHAPWTLVEAESKRFARVTVIETVIARIEERVGAT